MNIVHPHNDVLNLGHYNNLGYYKFKGKECSYMISCYIRRFNCECLEKILLLASDKIGYYDLFMNDKDTFFPCFLCSCFRRN